MNFPSVRPALNTLFVPVILLLAMLADRTGAIDPIDQQILDWRMARTVVPATGQTVFVAIDSKSLNEIGVWPWPRSVHAQLLDVLVEAGAGDIFIDIDFAFATDPDEDAALARSLAEAGGAVLLPVFLQERSVQSTDTGDLTQNRPLDTFAAQSWLALANVRPAADGKIRSYPFGMVLDGEDLPSVAALLSGALGPPDTEFPINYAISPRTVPAVSLVDVLHGRVPQELLEGRSIVVGAHAQELRDSLSVPVHGVVPGAMIHILATETLTQGVVPGTIVDLVIFGLLLIVLALFQITRLDARPWLLLAAIAAVIAATEAVGLILFQSHALVLPSGVMMPTLLVYGLWRLVRSLNLSAFLIRHKQQLIDNTRNLLQQVFDDSADAIVVIDAQGVILRRSANAGAVLVSDEREGEALHGALLTEAQSAISALRAGTWTKPPLRDLSVEVAGAHRVLQYTLTPTRLIQQSQNRRRTDDLYIATISARDVTQLRQQSEHLDYLSRHDARTGALRRGEFERLLAARMAKGGGITVLAINLHRFKTINATLGRKVGDAVLRKTVERLQAARLGLSPVVRLEGDSFAVFAETPGEGVSVGSLATAIAEVVGRIYHLGDATAQVGVRIGYTCAEDLPGVTAAELILQAEAALDAARQGVGTQIRQFDPAVSRQQVRARAIERAMWDAVDRQEFHLVYQPQIRLADGSLFGVEALLRWKNGELGKVFPDEFIPVAESNGFITDLGRWVLGQGCRDALRLPSDVTLSVNVSAAQMWNADIREDVENALMASGLAPSRLCLELTETVFFSPSPRIVETMNRLRMLGVSWALDDFGAGYSSLGYLSKLPLKKIKLDKQFAQTLDRDPDALAIVRSVIKLCHGIDVGLLCEGIETERQAEILLAEGCTEGQGYLYGKPMRLEQLIAEFDLGPRSDRRNVVKL